MEFARVRVPVVATFGTPLLLPKAELDAAAPLPNPPKAELLAAAALEAAQLHHFDDKFKTAANIIKEDLSVFQIVE